MISNDIWNDPSNVLNTTTSWSFLIGNSATRDSVGVDNQTWAQEMNRPRQIHRYARHRPEVWTKDI